MSTEPKIVVCFRMDKRGDDKQVTAVFPFEDEGRGFLGCYAHLGQHGTCSPAWVTNDTRPATPAEYAPLKRELEAAPYRYRFEIRQRFPSWRARRAAK